MHNPESGERLAGRPTTMIIDVVQKRVVWGDLSGCAGTGSSVVFWLYALRVPTPERQDGGERRKSACRPDAAKLCVRGGGGSSRDRARLCLPLGLRDAFSTTATTTTTTMTTTAMTTTVEIAIFKCAFPYSLRHHRRRFHGGSPLVAFGPRAPSTSFGSLEVYIYNICTCINIYTHIYIILNTSLSLFVAARHVRCYISM